MRAAVVNEFGQAPKYQSIPDPTPEEGEAIIRVRAAGLHSVVKALASGTHYASGGEVPFVPGVDGVGGNSPMEAESISRSRANPGVRCANAQWLRDLRACRCQTKSMICKPQR